MNPPQNHQAWADVAVFRDLDDAKVLEVFLNDKRMEARTYDDRWFRYFLFLRPPEVTYRVQVRANHYEGVTPLLRAKAPGVFARAIHCPSCGSLQVNYPQMTRKFIMPTLLLHLGILFRLIKHLCYCEHCHAMWNLPEKDEIIRNSGAAEWFPY